MTPLNLGTALVIYLVFCFIASSGRDKGTKEFFEISGGVAIVFLFVDLIWAAFYYIKF